MRHDKRIFELIRALYGPDPGPALLSLLKRVEVEPLYYEKYRSLRDDLETHMVVVLDPRSESSAKCTQAVFAHYGAVGFNINKLTPLSVVVFLRHKIALDDEDSWDACKLLTQLKISWLAHATPALRRTLAVIIAEPRMAWVDRALWGEAKELNGIHREPFLKAWRAGELKDERRALVGLALAADLTAEELKELVPALVKLTTNELRQALQVSRFDDADLGALTCELFDRAYKGDVAAAGALLVNFDRFCPTDQHLITLRLVGLLGLASFQSRGLDVVSVKREMRRRKMIVSKYV